MKAIVNKSKNSQMLRKPAVAKRKKTQLFRVNDGKVQQLQGSSIFSCSFVLSEMTEKPRSPPIMSGSAANV